MNRERKEEGLFSNEVKEYFSKSSFLEPRKINIVDLALLVLIITAFYYPAKINPWYKIREAQNLADDAYGVAEEALNLAEEIKSDFDHYKILN